MTQRTQGNIRKAGVMLPITALPSRHGIGDMGAQGMHFVDVLKRSGARYWQILPINPLGFGNSPYQPYSSFAGDPILISLDALYEQGLLAKRPDSFREAAERVDYADVRGFKDALLREAFAAFVPDAGYEAFIAQPWVHQYAVFMAFKHANGMRSWVEWPDAYKNWPDAPQAVDLALFEDEIRYEMFLQYTFFTQWMALKGYANARGIEIIGDIPIYVGIDSLDVWAGRENFLLDAQGEPTVVAGVPPDYFSATGQRWGNPIYDWAHMQAEGFSFWIERLRYSAELFDVIRIDHFRGFDTYWEIPASCPTAVEGEWKEAPGYALFDIIMRKMPGIQIIAEDLGMLRDEVYVLRDHYHFRGMNILQFTFDPRKPLAPAAGKRHMVVYTGTHDNQTTVGWFAGQPAGWRVRARWRLFWAGYRGAVNWCFVRLALDDAADIAVLPVQDIVGLDDAARMNMPGTVGSPNWEWKMTGFATFEKAMDLFGGYVRKSGRDIG